MTDGDLADVLLRCLREMGPADASEIARFAAAQGTEATAVQRVAKVLYLRPDLFRRVKCELGTSLWAPETGGRRPAATTKDRACRPNPSPAPIPSPPVQPEPITATADLRSMKLHPWQREALDAWRAAGHRGVVEAVTGAGKTRIALCAIIDALADPRARAAVLVPTTALAAQWRDRLRELDFASFGVPAATVGMIGGGTRDSMADHRIIVSTNQSASRRLLLGQAGPSILVGDEVHRLGAPTWARALDNAFHRRLGLTATLEREDEGVDELIRPYFGDTVFTLGLGRALHDGIVAPFRVTFLSVRLSPAEQQRYDDASKAMGQSLRALERAGTIPMQPFGTMMKAIQGVALQHGTPLTGPARLYLKSFADRRSTLAEARGKPERLAQLIPTIARSGRVLLFAETTKATRAALAKMRAMRIPAAAIDGSTDPADRERVMQDFRAGRIQLVAAPKVLDEGIDVPEADVGVILGGSASRRQLIQRLGRVIRMKSDGRAAHVFVLFVHGTPEDPESRAREDVVSELCQHAQSVEIIPPDEEVEG